jgi:hypothetical protein
MLYLIVLMSVIFGFMLLGAAAALLTSFFPDALTSLRAAHRRFLGVDAAVALMAAAGFGLVLQRGAAILMDRFHAHALFSMDAPELIVSAAPAAAAIAEALRATLTNAAMLGVITLIAARLPKRWMMALMGLLGGFTMLPPDVRTAGEFALHYGIALLTVAAAAAFVICFARSNYLAYALVLWVLALRGPLAELSGADIPALRIHAWAVAGAMGLAIVWALLPAAKRKPDTV